MVYQYLFPGSLAGPVFQLSAEICGFEKLTATYVGPDAEGAHSPDERVEFSSVLKFWNFLVALIEKMAM